MGQFKKDIVLGYRSYGETLFKEHPQLFKRYLKQIDERFIKF